ncbi:site-specific DNA-methyltransferase [Neisseria meningitidis]|nr:site-specific DNA-methyltransferase [Neisseria meningitidis]MBH5560235.1 site-specific DNA-methyltransferase [Neisseria meningitidis]MBH5574005.1 site-specific DNA-methyltransferase [Neisseria meningitidis]MBH5575829.1 site-specific DNA-methyltransferase [Neisseria meningitidis]MBH5607239.1 site-specific DNA-methyltransferase [Neisseria meningitidis]
MLPSQAKPSQAKPSQAKPSQAKPSQAKPSQAKPSQAKPSPDLSDTAGANTEAIYTSDGITANSTQLEQLKKLFPACFDADGNFLIDRLQAEIAPQTDIGREFYEMNWLGKSYARLLRNLPPETLISEDKTHNAKPENAGSQNLLIRGDNLEVLKHLKNAYTNSVKMIYIDPPYNTGSDGFVYQDDRKFTPAELARLANIDEDEAARILDFTDKGSNSHSAWLTFMYPRLYVARELLKDDGVIFISIDDNEAAQLKLLCDEVFGEGNFVDTLTIKKSANGMGSKDGYSTNHDFILIYLKEKQNNVFFGITVSEDYIESFNKEDEFGRYKTDGLFRKKGRSARREDSPDFANDKLYRLYASPKGTVYVKDYWHDELREKPRSILEDSSYLTDTATNEIINLFGSKVFSTPKPISLLIDLIDNCTHINEIILDFFAGSGTTAHAVIELSRKYNQQRNFISVQITDDLHEAYKKANKDGKEIIQNAINWLDEHHKPHNLFEITKARIELAAAKIRAEHPDYTGDLGFKIFQTADNFRQHPDNDFSPEQPDLPLSDELSEEQLQTLLTTWTLYDGAALTTPVEPVRLGSYTAYLCEKRLYLMNAGFTSADLLAFIRKLDDDAAFNPNRVIVFGSNMASAMQHELDQAVRGYANKKEIELNVVIRV